MKKRCLQVIMAVAVMVLMLIFSASAKTYCSKYSGPALYATYEYLDEMYLGKGNNFGLTLHYGAPVDKEIIKNKAKEITKSCKTNSQKATAVAEWIAENIDYYEDTSNQSSVDVLLNREGNCLGYAYLLSDMLRSVGVISVPATGYVGDMDTLDEKYILDVDSVGHAFTFVYLDGEWKFFDMLFDVYASVNSTFIADNYFITSIEGVMPYYSEIYYPLQKGAAGIYKNGKTYAFDKENNCLVFGHFSSGSAHNVFYNFDTAVKYDDPDGFGKDGWEYTVNPERRKSMINGECYKNGWINYSNLSWRYVHPNGISFQHLIIKDGKDYIYDDEYVLTNGIEEYFLEKGCLVLYDGEPISFTFRKDSLWLTRGKKIEFYFDGTLDSYEESGRATVGKDGKISVKKDGYIMLCYKEISEDGVVRMDGALTVYVTKTAQYADCDYGRHIYRTVSVTKHDSKNEYTTLKECVGCKKAKTIVKDYSNNVISSIETMTAPQRVKIVSASQTADSVTLKWEKAVGADGYAIYRYDSKTNKYKKIKTVKSGKTVKYKVTGLKAGKTYKFKVKAYRNKNGKTLWGTASKVFTTATKPKKAVIRSIKSAKAKTVTVVWDTVSGASGYQVRYSTSDKFTNKTTKYATVQKQKSKKVTLKKLKKGKKYYIKVRAFRTVNGKKIYGAYSKVKSVKIR